MIVPDQSAVLGTARLGLFALGSGSVGRLAFSSNIIAGTAEATATALIPKVGPLLDVNVTFAISLMESRYATAVFPAHVVRPV